MEIITHHGMDFGIDIADWGPNRADGERAGEILKDWLIGLDAATTAHLHAKLSDADTDFDDPLVKSALDAGNRAVIDVTRDWKNQPDTGHNCDLVAV